MLLKTNTVLIATTTPNGINSAMNEYAQMVDSTGAPVFHYLNIGKVCIQCASYGLTRCHHGPMITSPWLDSDRREKLMPVLYGDNKELLRQEIYAEITENKSQAFLNIWIDYVTKTFINFNMVSNQTIITFCDPSGEKSQVALVSAYYYNGRMIVSKKQFFLFFLSVRYFCDSCCINLQSRWHVNW